MGRFVDLTGQTFGRLKVLHRVENHCGRTAYMCECSCKDKTRKVIIGKSLANGKTVSCGCYISELSKLAKYRRYNTYNLTGSFGIGYDQKGKEFYFELSDYDKIKDYCWNTSVQGYIESNTTKKTKNVVLRLHRFLLDVTDKSLEVDHIDGKRNDCRRKNLRIVTNQQNAMNAKKRKDNTSSNTGVSLCRGKWLAKINYNYKQIHLGYFKDKQSAITAREIAELKLFGEYSRRYEELLEKYSHLDLTQYKPYSIIKE